MGLARRVADRLGFRRSAVVHVGKDGRPIPMPRKLSHFHTDEIEPGRTRWDWPPHLSTQPRLWLSALRELYRHPLSHPMSLSPEAGLLLHALVLNHRPRACIETGSNIGISALWIAGALEEHGAGTLTCFDNFLPIVRPGVEHITGDERKSIFENALRGAKLEHRVRIVAGDSPRTIPREASAIGRVQLAFLDGDHTFDGVLADFLAVEPMLDTGGLIVLHDTFPSVCAWDGPRRLLNTLHEHGEGTYQPIDLYLGPINYGMALMRRLS